MLYIFGREAWLTGPAPVHFSLSIRVTSEAARARLVAEWAELGPEEISAAYGVRGSNTERRNLAFYSGVNGLFTAWETFGGGDGAIELSSPCPPDRLAYSELASPAVPLTAGLLPACLEPEMAEHWGEPASLALAGMVSERLREDDLVGAIRLFTYSRSGLPEAEIAGAAREVFTYLARYPLQRDPLLGAFLASLCAEAAAR